MKNKTEPSLEKLRKEIENLKKTKEKKLQIATSMTERNKLLREINELDAIKKSPNALRSFGKTFSRGLKTTARTLWKGISRASRNLDKNAPEFKKFSKTMTLTPKIPKQLPKKKSKKRKEKARRMVQQSMPSWGLP